MACSTMMYDAFPGKRDISLANPYYYHAENAQADGSQMKNGFRYGGTDTRWMTQPFGVASSQPQIYNCPSQTGYFPSPCPVGSPESQQHSPKQMSPTVQGDQFTYSPQQSLQSQRHHVQRYAPYSLSDRQPYYPSCSREQRVPNGIVSPDTVASSEPLPFGLPGLGSPREGSKPSLHGLMGNAEAAQKQQLRCGDGAASLARRFQSDDEISHSDDFFGCGRAEHTLQSFDQQQCTFGVRRLTICGRT
jgi:hypothetical protein